MRESVRRKRFNLELGREKGSRLKQEKIGETIQKEFMRFIFGYGFFEVFIENLSSF